MNNYYFKKPKTDKIEPFQRKVFDFSKIKLKDDYKYKPVYAVIENGEKPRIILETFTDYYKEIVDFLVAIGEPKVRTKNFQEYELTPFSLYSAASMGITNLDISQVLNNISKNELQEELEQYISQQTETYGIARIVLKNNRYFIICKDDKTLHQITKIQEVNISNKKLSPKMEIEENQEAVENIPSIGDNYIEIHREDFGTVRDACLKNNYPLLEEFDFKQDKGLELKLCPSFKSPVRSYQEKALNIMCSNGVARSGIIVLPCGAGKTLVGILAMCTIKRNTMIICNNNVAVQQWFQEIKNWVKEEEEEKGGKDKQSVICRFTSKVRDPLWDFKKKAGILITSYTMISLNKKRNAEVQKALDLLKSTDWGLMIIDEVQLLPAGTFSNIISKMFKSHCKLGLTATLVREDNKIVDLHFLIGPKHYEANWLDLQKEGFLARVKCTEIWTEMEPEFYKLYLEGNLDLQKKKALYVSNPYKYLVTLMLLEKHKGDKIIIFRDNLFSIKQYNYFFEKRGGLNYKMISGETRESERQAILRSFKEDDGVDILLMTKVGDISIDVPNAKVIIQVSSHFGSRMQETQRFGRILRPKKDSLSEYNAFFYTIVSKNTEEMKYSSKRHKYLVDQGYYFNIITKFEEIFDYKSENEAKEIIKNYEKDPNYLDYRAETYNAINENKDNDKFKNDYDDEQDSYKILVNKEKEEKEDNDLSTNFNTNFY